MHKIGSLQWFSKNEAGRWLVDSAMENHCPPGDFGVISSQGFEEHAIGKALDHNPTVDETTGALPWCAERAIEQGYYSPAPDLTGDLLEYEYTNFAFGFMHTGFVVDQRGQVFATSSMTPPPESLDRFSVVGAYLGVVPTEELSQMQEILQDLDVVEMPEPEEIRCCDLGTGRFLGWRYNPENGEHDILTLATDHSLDWAHPDPSAAEIVQWLDGFRKPIFPYSRW